VEVAGEDIPAIQAQTEMLQVALLTLVVVEEVAVTVLGMAQVALVALVLLLFATQDLHNGLQAAQLLVLVTGLFTHLHLLEHWLLRLLRS
jgi:hypothetical protein